MRDWLLGGLWLAFGFVDAQLPSRVFFLARGTKKSLHGFDRSFLCLVIFALRRTVGFASQSISGFVIFFNADLKRFGGRYMVGVEVLG